jgi:hypothetical protein
MRHEFKMNAAIDILEWLENWYQSNCDRAWEHDHGITIQSLDNPGWWIQIDLRKLDQGATTSDQVLVVVGEPPGPENGNIGGDVWMKCEIKNNQFDGSGDPSQLRSILACFRSLIEKSSC